MSTPPRSGDPTVASPPDSASAPTTEPSTDAGRTLFDFSGFEPPTDEPRGRAGRGRKAPKPSARRAPPPAPTTTSEPPPPPPAPTTTAGAEPATPVERPEPPGRLTGTLRSSTTADTSARPATKTAVRRVATSASADGNADRGLADAFDPSTFFPSNVFEKHAVLAAPVTPRLPFEPSLQGLRGVAIIAVLLYFADVPFLGGGFLAISTFLTLAGFLVTRNLLGRMLNDEPIVFTATMKTRLRRLMPIGVLGIAVGVLYTVTLGDVGQVNSLFGDVVTSITYTANWRFIAQSLSYLTLLASPSALQQYWSLAIAEQVNLVVLLAALGAAFSVRRRASRDGHPIDARQAVRALTVVLGVLLFLSIACTLALGYSHSRVYFGTDTRAAELLLGALLAVMLVHRPSLGSSKFAPTIALTGAIAAVASVALWLLTPINSPWVYSGGLVAYALVSMAVVAGSLIPRSPLATALSVGPLREVGKVAYGLYVFSWPVFLVLSPERVPLPAPFLFVLRIAVTGALAVAAHRFIDAPVRAGKQLYSFTPRAAVGGAIAVIMLTTMATASNAPDPAIDLSQPYTAAGTEIGNGSLDIPSFAVFGDSTAIPIQRGLGDWAESTNRAVSRTGRFAVGCGVVPGGAWQLGATTGDTPESCDTLQEEWASALEPGAPTMAIVTPGLLEVANRRVPGDDRWRAIGVPEVELYYVKQMLAVTDTLGSKGAKVVWLTMPPVVAGTQHDARPALGQAVDPARAKRLNELIDKLPDLRPDKVAVIDLAGWLEQNDPTGSKYRPDGVHLSDEGAKVVAQDLLAPELLKLAGQDPNSPIGPTPGASSAGSPGAKPACKAILTFQFGDVAALSAGSRSRSEREQAFSALQTAGAQLQQVAPELNDAIETREAYAAKVLNLGDPTGTAPPSNPGETGTEREATAALKQYQTEHCR